jgi:bifunctional non-homologous end joining protein LigD
MNFEPMLAQSLDYEYHEETLEPKFTEQQFQWDAEVKLDGIRMLVYIEPNCNNSRALTRVKGKHTGAYANKGPHLAWLRTDGLVDDLTVLDGEVTWGKNSRTTMEILGCHANESLRRQVELGPLKFTAFDILMGGGRDFRYKTYEQRRDILHAVMFNLNTQFPGEVDWVMPGPAKALWAKGGEGIMLKEPMHNYQAGCRSPSWLKVKRFKKYIAVVTGYTAGKEGKTGQMVGLMGSLWLGMLDHRGILMPVGAAGTGFGMTERSPLAWPVRTVVEVASSDVTEDGKLWHPRFLKRRPDLRVEDAQLSQLGV